MGCKTLLIQLFNYSIDHVLFYVYSNDVYIEGLVILIRLILILVILGWYEHPDIDSFHANQATQVVTAVFSAVINKLF